VNISPVEANRDLDYAILSVQGNPSATYGTVPLYVRDPLPQEELFLIHHPAGLTQRITRQGCRLSDSIRAVYGSELRHRCDTKGGSSGALIFSDNQENGRFYVVGLHYAGFAQQTNDAYNSAKRFTALLEQSPILRGLAQTNTTAAQLPAGTTLSPLDRILQPKPTTTAPATPTPVSPGNASVSNRAFTSGLDAHFNASADTYRMWQRRQLPHPVFPVLGALNAKRCMYIPGSGTSDAVRANCTVAVEGAFEQARALVRTALQTRNARILADDSRGLAARLPNGITACLMPTALGGLFANTDGQSVYLLYLTSPDYPAPTCFLNPPISLK
ncbi:MAG: serine protease, partial [Bacteroidota bacterium]